MSPALLFPFLPFVFFPLVIFLALRDQRRRSRFADQLASLGAAGEGTSRLFNVGARQIRTEYHPGGKNDPCRFLLVTAVTAPGSFTLASEGSGDRFFEGLGLEGKISSRDPDFDARVHIVSDDEGFAQAYFSSPAKRAAVLALLAQGCTRVELGEKGLMAVWSPFILKDDMGVDFIRDSVPHVAALADELPLGIPFSLPSGLNKKQFNLIFAGGLALLILGFFCLPMLAQSVHYVPLDGWALFLDSVRYSAYALAAFLLVVLSAIKGKSWFFTGMTQMLFLGVIFVPFAGYWTTLWVNCKLDTAPAQEHAVWVEYRYATSGKHGNRYHVRLSSWRSDRGPVTFIIPRWVYDKLEPGRTAATVVTKPGRLGHEWLVSYRFSPPPANP